MAPGDASKGEHAPIPCPMTFKCFNGICRTAGVVPARGGQEWSEKNLIGTNSRHEDDLHCISASRVAVIVLSGQENSTGTPMLEMTCYRFNLGSELGKARHVSVRPSAEYDV